MTVSAIAIGVERLKSVIDTPVFAIHPDAGTCPAVVVNRLFERDDEELGHVIGLMISVLSDNADDIERIGDEIIEKADDSGFDFGDLIDIRFDKEGRDCTGYDYDMGRMFRAIEFMVRY